MSDEQQRFGDGQDDYLKGARKAAEAAKKAGTASARPQEPLLVKQLQMRQPLPCRPVCRAARPRLKLRLALQQAAHGVRYYRQPGPYGIRSLRF